MKQTLKKIGLTTGVLLLAGGVIPSTGENPLSNTIFSSIEAEASSNMYQTSANLNMRTGASTKHKVILTIPKGKSVSLISKSGSWAKVTYSGKTGYVSTSYIQKIKIVKVVKKTKYPVTLHSMVKKQYSLHAQTDKYRYQSAYIDKKSVKVVKGKAVIQKDTDVKSSTSSNSHVYGVYKKGKTITLLGQTKEYYKVSFGAWRNARVSDISPMVDPSKVSSSSSSYYQFLDLSKPAGISTYSMNKVLKWKGILSNRGKAFLDASKKYSVNEVYLASHSMLETGNGTSVLSRGVTVSSVEGKKVKPRKVYNMYGIGAVDSAPLKGGSERAYKEGWFTPEAAIIGGAKYISEAYVNNPLFKQNTLYKMRWNPERPGEHQYATDIGWAMKQVPHIYNLYRQLDEYTLTFDVPQYAK